ncbi:MAG: N-6 DNA methylase [Rhodobacteraceae bacterium]|nr:N-6 DNA methylase [Paracoccaceae bacterium]
MDSVARYIRDIRKVYQTGTATEHSYRPALVELLRSIDNAVTVQNEARPAAGTAPDITLSRNDSVLGYVEAKTIDVDLSNLTDANAAQKARYLQRMDKLVYTNYLDWELYLKGTLISDVRIATLESGKIKSARDNFHKLKTLLGFLIQDLQNITGIEDLVTAVANRAVLIRADLKRILKKDDSYRKLFEFFREHLIHDLAPDDFADTYAETVAYGVLAARIHTKEGDFTRRNLKDMIPKSNRFLRGLFSHIAEDSLNCRIAGIIDDLVDIFKACDINSLLESAEGADPFLHFYEKFLDIYNPEKRRDRGVWYTPEPVVKFIVRAVDDVLKKEFRLQDGLADTSKTETGVHRVQILDPATGTGTFLAEVMARVAHTVRDVTGGGYSDYIRKDLVPRLHGFEILMAPYVVCHIKLNMMLKNLGYEPKDESERLSVYLTNSLESGGDIEGLFYPWFIDEVKAAAEIKSKKPIMCVIGNPPYLGEGGVSKGWFGTLMEGYKKEPGGAAPLEERNPKWLNDSYVKFIRLSEHLIERNGAGVVAFITNHGYLDNPTFRGMRWHLMRTFDSIHVLDLHGNTRKKETAPDGSEDENVFDIQQGVAILVAVRKKGNNPELARVYRGDLRGSRAAKYKSLAIGTMQGLIPKKLDVRGPRYTFKYRDHALAEVYEQGFSIKEFMPVNSAGIVTARDDLVTDFTREDLTQKIGRFLDSSKTDDQVRAEFFPDRKAGKYLPGDNKKWKLSAARSALQATDWHQDITPVAYRPFDTRALLYRRDMVEGMREQVMRHMLHDNVGLATCRQVKNGNDYAHAFCTKTIMESSLISNKTSEIGTVSPLYLYLCPENGNVSTARTVNFNPALWNRLKDLAAHPGHDTPDELQTFDYIYGTLHAPVYRTAYAEFLKEDFPRIPWPATPDEFWHISAKGAQLRKLHLMDRDTIGPAPYPLEGDGGNNVDKPRFDNGRIYINKTRCFTDVPEVSWNFHFGGYRPAQKWLKDRQGRVLDLHDIRHCQSILKILSETDRIMRAIDMCQPEAGQTDKPR